MFFGLNNFLKYLLPKRLFYRALIIVAAPTIILQIIITIVFFDSIWIKANKNNTRSLVAQLKTIEEIYRNDKNNLDFFTDSYKNNFNFEIGINQDDFPNISGERKFSPMDRSLRRELKSTFGNNNYWFNTSKYKNAVKQMEILIKNKEKDKAKKYFSKFQSILMQVAKSGIINKNTASRKISRISKKISSK